MSLDGPHTHAVVGSAEDVLLKACRSSGFAVRYTPDDAVHRILEPTPRGMTCVGLVMIRNRGIVYAEFDRVVFPWWGRSPGSEEYLDSFTRLADLVAEGSRK